MPLVSKAQARMFFAKKKSGEMSPGMVNEFVNATPSIKGLPEHVDSPKLPQMPGNHMSSNFGEVKKSLRTKKFSGLGGALPMNMQMKP